MNNDSRINEIRKKRERERIERMRKLEIRQQKQFRKDWQRLIDKEKGDETN